MMTTVPASIALLVLSAAILCNGQESFQFEDSDQCTTPNDAKGTCINIRQCSPLLEVLRNQRQRPGAADFLRRSVCGYSGLDPNVCCPSNNPETQPQPNIASGATGLPTPNECGFSNISSIRVVGGKPADLGAWPWLVALGYKPSSRSSSQAPRYLCGASLITNRHVLTAAHCVYNRADLYFARLGDLDLKSDTDGANPVNIPIAEKKVHEDYSPTQFTNDIAILTLQETVTYTSTLRPICLPITPQLRSRDYLKTTPFIAGWGAQNFSGPSSSRLLQIQIPTVPVPQCKQAFARFKSAVIDDRILCAGYLTGGKDACQGDSGGPLMWPQGPTTYYQIGVVSYGYRCAEPGIPGVYTRVTAFMDWIIANIK